LKLNFFCSPPASPRQINLNASFPHNIPNWLCAPITFVTSLEEEGVTP